MKIKAQKGFSHSCTQCNCFKVGFVTELMYSRSQNDEKKIFVSPCCTHREAAAAIPPLTALPLGFTSFKQSKHCAIERNREFSLFGLSQIKNS